MNEINIIMDRSGSMETNAKESICLNIIQAVNIIVMMNFNSLTINKLKFGNTKEEFEQLKTKIHAIPTLILTDGYYFFDFYRGELNSLLEENINNLYFVICGADGINLSIYKKDFPKINIVQPDNIIYALEKILRTDDGKN